jgi:hypothetical protein
MLGDTTPFEGEARIVRAGESTTTIIRPIFSTSACASGNSASVATRMICGGFPNTVRIGDWSPYCVRARLPFVLACDPRVILAIAFTFSDFGVG